MILIFRSAIIIVILLCFIAVYTIHLGTQTS